MCALSYDSVEVLDAFARRKGITVPLLSDPDSAVIRRLGLLNETVPPGDARQHGMAHPGTIVADGAGIVRDVYFEDHYVHRFTMPTILASGFGEAPEGRRTEQRLDHADVVTFATQDRVHPGNRITLSVRVAPHPGVHAYASGAEAFGYQPLALSVEAPAHCTVHAPRYPDPDIVDLAGDRVPVYARPAEIRTDLVLGSRQDLAEALAAGMLAIRGILSVQTCSEQMCDPPREVSLQWELGLVAPDTERVPEPLRRENRPKP